MKNEYQHGADIYGKNKIELDYSSNINPLGVPESFKKAVISQMEDFSRYPDFRYAQLKKAISGYTNMNEDNIVVDNGLIELMAKVIKMKGFKRLVTINPTFLEYERIAHMADLEVDSLPLIETIRYEDNEKHHEYEIDLDQLLQHIKKDDLIIICNPNNPTGTIIEQHAMKMLATKAAKKGCFLVIDEAFMELTRHHGEESFLSLLKEHKNVMVFRAVTKYFGLPGVRMGYGLTYNEKVLSYLERHIGPWQLNTAAAICGIIFNDKEYVDKSKMWLQTEIDWMYEKLREVKGVTVYRSHTMYHLLRLHDITNDQLLFKMEQQGILLRHHKGFKGLNEHFIRIAVKDRESNRRLIACFRQALYSINM